MKDVPPDIQQKLRKISDSDISAIERVHLELDMMKSSPEEKRILMEFKSKRDHLRFFKQKDCEEKQRDAKRQSDYEKEVKKENEFKKSVEEKRRKEEEEELARKRRIKQAEIDARQHAAKEILEGMTQMKDAALVAKKGSDEWKAQKELEEKEEQQRIENFRRKSKGKYVDDAQLALKEAIMVQKELPSNSDFDSDSDSDDE